MVNSLLKKVLTLKGPYYTWAESLIYFTGVALMIIILVVCYEASQAGNHIKCYGSKTTDDIKVVERECFMKPFIVNKNNTNDYTTLDDIPSKEYRYYRWFIASMLLKILVIIMHLSLFNGIVNIEPLNAVALDEDAPDKDGYSEKVNNFSSILIDVINTKNKFKEYYIFTAQILFVKVLNFVTPCILYTLIYLLLKPNSYFWVFDSNHDELFPMEVFCSVDSYVGPRKNQKIIRCFLELNYTVNVFALLFSCWCLFLLAINFLLFLNFIYHIFFNRISFFNKYVMVKEGRQDIRGIRQVIYKFLHHDGALILRMLENRLGKRFVAPLLDTVFEDHQESQL